MIDLKDEYTGGFLAYEVFKDYIYKLLKNLKISNLKHSIEYRIVKKVYYEFLEYQQGVYANEVFKGLKINKKKFYRLIDKLTSEGIIKKEKKEGYLILNIPDRHKQLLLNLISIMQKSNSEFMLRLGTMGGIFKDNPRMIKYYAISEFIKKNTLDALDRNKLLELFLKYLGAIENKKIVLYNREKQKLLKLNYKTRFNDAGRLYKNIDKFYSLFENAATKFKNAVFITLTLDPKRHKNIFIAAKKSSEALNRFLSFLKKKFKKKFKKISYINTFEFNGNGMTHLHMVIFGFDWLMPQKVLSRLWSKYRMGKIVYLYSLKYSDEEMGYIFNRNKPKDAKENNVSDYLIKYLKKAFYDKTELALYWLTNKRFFTYSRDLKEEEEEKPKSPGGWEYVGKFNNDLFNDLLDEEFILYYVDTLKTLKKRGLLLPT